jgi:hypothetical protein
MRFDSQLSRMNCQTLSEIWYEPHDVRNLRLHRHRAERLSSIISSAKTAIDRRR